MPASIFLAQNQEIQELIERFQAQALQGTAVAQMEVLVRTAIFKSANDLVGWLFQQAADRIAASYQPKPGEIRKGRVSLRVQGMFGSFEVKRDYYYRPGKKEGHYPADAAKQLVS